jgi:CelD/BcsL family acetyltransferase involved in cellulose biosynthesis
VTASPAAQLTLERIPYEPVAWEATITGHPDLEVYHGSDWLDFLAVSQGAEPVIAVVRSAGHPVGHFVGAIVRRFGVRILGSPLRGWGTQCMGFLLDEGIDRRRASDALALFAFRELGCLHVELADRQLTGERMAASGYATETGRTFVVDLRPSEEEILGAMRPRVRTYVRSALRNGLVADPCTGVDFADEYYRQLVEVFARQGLVPTYGVERVRQLIRSLEPSGHVLLLRVRAPSGESVATAVVIGRDRTAILWGAASHRTQADLHPNELLHWEAMRHWRARGTLRYDMGGGGDYKAKYGGTETPTYIHHRSRYAFVGYGRSTVRGLYRARQIVRGRREAQVDGGARS